MSRKKNKLKANPNNFKLLDKDADFVSKENILKIFDLLDQELDQHDIHEMIPEVSKRQIKLIRWVKGCEDEEAIEKLKTGLYNISRLKANIVLRKHIHRFIYEILFTDRYDFTIKREHHIFKRNKGLHWKGVNAIRTYVKSKMLERHIPTGNTKRIVDFPLDKNV